MTIRSADLRHMTKDEIERAFDLAFECADETLEATLAELGAGLREFELRYELPTSKLSEALSAGRLHETADVSKWLFWARLRDDLIAQKARA